MQTIEQRLAALRAKMREAGYAGYYIPTDDFHLSEYVGAHFKARAYMSGFTGSAGTLVVLEHEAALWVDGRYFLQGEQQLCGTPITLQKSGEEGVPTILEYLKEKLPEGGVLGMDGRTVPAATGLSFKKELAQRKVTLAPERDLVGEIWADRPPLSDRPAWVLDTKYAGQEAGEKLAAVRTAMAEHAATAHVLASLDDIAWLFNLRGDDVAYNPVLLAYAVIEPEKAYLFAEEGKLPEAVRAHLASLNTEVLPYGGVYDFVARYGAGTKVLLSESRINYALYARLVDAGASLVDAENPTVYRKAVKNAAELENLRRAHIKDAVAMVRFMRYLKDNIGKIPMTEISASDYLESLRRAQEGNLGLSFDTICGYGPHGAIVHYAATPESDVPLAPRGLLLVDSGGQYYEGTTDITRTFALGPLTEEEKLHFATVLRSMLNLAAARFLSGVRGANLDVLARAPFWEQGLDYKHGTGHGVGYLLNVHEASVGRTPRIPPCWRREWSRPMSRACTLRASTASALKTNSFAARVKRMRSANSCISSRLRSCPSTLTRWNHRFSTKPTGHGSTLTTRWCMKRSPRILMRTSGYGLRSIRGPSEQAAQQRLKNK